MKTAGMDMSSAAAAQLARQANSALQLRLHQGGESMPPFPHLSEAEIRALSAYLKQLAQLPGAESQQLTVQESRLRVGEHIVKSTCQTCHSAVGLDPTPRQLLDGAIPPLSSLTARVTLPALVRKVTQGAPIVMGEPAIACRGRMPVFSYLTEDEASDVYLYLTKYPPSQADANIVARAGVTGGIALLPRNDGDHKDPKDAGQTKAVVKRLLQYAGFPAILFLLFGGVILKGLPLVMPSPPRASAASGPSVRLQSVAPSGDDWPRCDADCVGAAESHETSKR
jgi:mono/diheme cytochrome c family protein